MDDEVVFARLGSEKYGGKPCPFEVSEAEKMKIRQALNEAEAVAETRAERTTLQWMAHRVERADGHALTTDFRGGCNDLHEEDYHHPVAHTVDTWRSP
ncbi:MAG: hypothetical protein WDN45_17190 [Caulobacteraceae bacterium]